MPKRNRPAFHYDGFPSPFFTPVPDDVFDVIMPELTEAELRVLLYIIRRTYGWKKASDDISLKQMVDGITTAEGKVLDRGAGVGKSAASRALRGLEDKGIIVSRHNSSRERGDEPTTFGLHFVEGVPQPVFPKRTRGVVEENRSRVFEENTQDTTLEKHEGRETDSNRRADQTPVDEDREMIREYVVDFRREFRDRASPGISTARAFNLYRGSGLDLEQFVDAMQEARRLTKGNANHKERPMAYWFQVLEDQLRQ